VIDARDAYQSEADRTELKSYILQAEEEYLNELLDSWRDDYPDFESATVWNARKWQGILDVAEICEADLVVKPVSRAQGLKKYLRTSDDWNLIRHANCEVLLVIPDPWPEQMNLLVALDAYDDEHEQLNRKLLTRARELGLALGARIHLVSAYPSFHPYSEKLGNAYGYDALKDALEDGLTDRVMELLEALEIESGSMQVHIREGIPQLAIEEVADEVAADITLIGTAARSGIAGFFLGNTAENILQYNESDVMTVRLNPERSA